MKRKIWLSCFLGLFLLLSLTLSVGMLAFGQSQAGANERLSAPPELTKKDGTWNAQYLQEAAAFVNDRFFLRQELITLDNRLTADLLGNSGEDKVIMGKDGWLFFTETLADYTGTAPLTEQELFAIGENLRLMQQYCTANGRDFVFVVAPNKNSVYGQFMPNFGVVSEIPEGKRLLGVLQEMGVNTVDLYAALTEQETPLYFAHDSHWNSRGAALGADLINQALGVESSYFGADFSRTEPHQGDLYEMVYPALTDREQNPVYSGKLDFSYTGKGQQPDSITIETAGSGGKTLLAYRDSFGNLLYPYLADSYAAAYFSRAGVYDLTREGDCVMVEIVERNLRNLLKNVPLMPAPAVSIDLPETGGSIEVDTKEKNEMHFVQGTLPQLPDDNTRVYLVCGGQAYGAFLQAEGGFGAYLPAQPEAVVYTAGETLVRLEIIK